MPSVSADDLPRYRLALARAISAWNLLAAHMWVRLAAALRQAHHVLLPDRFTASPDLPRTFPEAAASFQEALRQVSEFDEVPADSPWLWCGEQPLTLFGTAPDFDGWIDSVRRSRSGEWEKDVVQPFLARASETSERLQGLFDRFERTKEGIIATSPNRLETSLRVKQDLSRVLTEEHECQEAERAQRGKRLFDLLTAAINSMSPTDEPAEEWARRLTQRLASIGQEVHRQGWEEWIRASAEGEDFTREIAVLILEGDQDRINSLALVIRPMPAEMSHLINWLRLLKSDWSKVFDQGWLRWTLNREFPPPLLQSGCANPAPHSGLPGPTSNTAPESAGDTKEHREGERRPSKSPSSDGPFGLDGFRYQNAEVRFGRAAKQRSLVMALWDEETHRPHDPRPVQDILDEVYGQDHDTADAAFRQLCADTRSRLEKAAIPLSIETLQGNVQLTPRPP